MQNLNTFRKNVGPIAIILSVVASVLLVVGVVQAATTVGSNISTDGTVSVTGLTTLGQASTTRISVFDTAYFGGTATSTFSSAGNLSVAGTLGVTGASTLSSTLTVSGLTSLGQASSTRFSVFDTAYFGGTATSTFSSTGALTLAGNLVLATASSTGLATLDSIKISSVGDTLADVQHGTCTVTIGSITASTTAMATCIATGVTTAHKVFITPYITDNGIFMVSASSTANDTIQIAVHNVGYTGAVDPADNIWSWMAIK